MDFLSEKFARLGVDNAPGQELHQQGTSVELRGEPLTGTHVDFSHGDVDAFTPTPGAFEAFEEGFREGGKQAYTEYSGRAEIRKELARKLEAFTGSEIHAGRGMIITPGTQCALFLAMGATVGRGDKVAIVQPDYFANHKLVEFFDGQMVPIQMDYRSYDNRAGLNLEQLEQAFKTGVKLFLFSNPNNPAGVIYSAEEIRKIAELAQKYNVFLVVDELYSRQVFSGHTYTHLCGQGIVDPENLITIMGPSKTESLSGFRLGVAFGSTKIVERMEKLQAIVSLRAAGYNQAVLRTWFSEPEGWLDDRIAQHQAIRDDLVAKFQAVKGGHVRPTEAGSYLFVTMPDLDVSLMDFTKILRQHADVIVTPGTEFGPQFTHSFRINFSQDRVAAGQAADRICEMIERYRK